MLIAVLVIVVIVVASVAAYYTLTMSPHSSTTSSFARTSLVVEEQTQPDTLDSAVTYVTPGWEVVEQVYQGLVTSMAQAIPLTKAFLLKAGMCRAMV